MAKSKNHTARNQNRKAHRNGIHKPKRERYTALVQMNAKFLRNRRRALKFDPNWKKSTNLSKKIEKLRGK